MDQSPLIKYGKSHCKLAVMALCLLPAIAEAANLSTTGGGDIILDGTNSWIMHSPDDGRTELHLAPKKNGKWSWGDAYRFGSDGHLRVHGLASTTANPIWIGSNVQVYTPAHYQPALELSGEGTKDAFALYHAWNKSWFSSGFRQVDKSFVICHGNNLHNPFRFRIDESANVELGAPNGHDRMITYHAYNKCWFSAGLRQSDSTFVISPGNNLHNVGCFRIRGDGSAVIQTQSTESPLELGGDNLSRFVRFHDWGDASYTAGYHRGTRKFRICNAWDLEGGQLLEMDNGSITAHRHINAISLTASGNVQAGALRAGYVGTARLQVRSDWWADRVFADDYYLRPLPEVAEYIKEHKRLPEVPSEAELRRDGIDTAAMFATQMAKIEELTLHAIELHRQIRAKDAVIAELRLAQEGQAALLARIADRVGMSVREP